MVKWIKHPELEAEAEVLDESVPAWLDAGWVVKDDENVQSDESQEESQEQTEEVFHVNSEETSPVAEES